MTQPASDVNTAQSRHWLYGVNLALLIVVALMILVMIMIAVERSKGSTQWDISSNAVNSLSGQTGKLLQDITEKKQKFHLVSLFTDPSNEEKTRGDPNNQAEKRRQVMDLLNLYRKQSSYVQVDDWGDRARDDIEREIRDKYATELKPYEDAVQGFDEIAKQLREFATREAELLGAAVQQIDSKAEEREAAGQLQSTFRALGPALDEIQREIHRQADATLPEWDVITRDIKDKIDRFEAFLSLLSDTKQLEESPVPKGLLPYFKDANPRYKIIAAAVKTYLAQLDKLQTLQVQDVLAGVGRNTVVVLGPTSAKVISRGDIFETSAPTEAGGAPPTRFKGEEVVSSALLAMARPDKVKVVFVTGSPVRITTDQYSTISASLRESNFEVLEWSPPGGMTPDQPPNAEPPAQGKGVVWVVFPPEPPSQQMMMMMAPPDPRPVIAATKKHMDAGGQVMFLAESSGVNIMGPGDKYAYEELIQPFGIQVKPKYSVVLHTDRVDQATGRRVERYEQAITLTNFEDHEITRPMQAYPTVFFPSQALTVVDVARPAPDGVESKILVRTPNDPNYWGESDFTAKPSRDPQNDLASPVPIVSLAVKNRGKPDEQRVMVVGTKMIAHNIIFEQIQLYQVGNQIVPAEIYPGNRELFRNAILWLAGYENMIAVSTKASAGSRLTVSGSGLTMLRTTMMVFVPVIVLLIGILVWVVRHR